MQSNMSFIPKGDFKTRQQWLKKQKRANLKREEEKFNQKIKHEQPQPKLPTPVVTHKSTLNDILTLDTEHSMAASRLSQKIEEKPTPIFKKESDKQLHALMKTRLFQQEHHKHQQHEQIKQLNSEIQQIKTSNTFLKASTQDAQQIYETKEAAELENSALKQRVYEMEQYLLQHGARWTPKGIIGQFNIGKIKEDLKKAKTQYRTLNSFEFDIIERRTQEMNQSLTNELKGHQIINVEKIYKFKQPDTITVIFYTNGVSFQSIGFFTYEGSDGRRILTDLSDGYFPHVLRTKYPNGVFMSLTNNLNQSFQNDSQKTKEKVWFFGQAISFSDES